MDSTFQIENAKFPPDFFNNMRLISQQKVIPKGELFDYSKFTSKTQKKSGTGNDYAIIISNGSVDERIKNSILNSCELMYNALKKVYNYSDDNIYTLIGNGNNYGSVNVDYPATLEYISTVFSSLSTKITSNDRLFIYCMDHGDLLASNQSYMVINNGVLNDYVLASEVKKITSSSITIVLGQCFGGSFIDNLSSPNRIIITASGPSQESFPTEDCLYSEFTYHFVSALVGHLPNLTKVNADTNNDGFVSIREAFYYANDYDLRKEASQYNSRPAELGYTTTLNSNSATLKSDLAIPEFILNFNYSGADKTICKPFKDNPSKFYFGWKPSHGSPRLGDLTDYGFYDFLYLEAEFPEPEFIQKSEGVFIDFHLKPRHNYDIEIMGSQKYLGSLPKSNILFDIKAANSLVSTSYADCGLEKVPKCSDSKTILHDYVPSSSIPNYIGSSKRNFTLNPQDKYSQIWLYITPPSYKAGGGAMFSSLKIKDNGLNVPKSEEEKVYTAVVPAEPVEPELMCSSGIQFECSQSNWNISHGSPEFLYNSDREVDQITLMCDKHPHLINPHRISSGVYSSCNFLKGKTYTVNLYIAKDDQAEYSCDYVLNIYAASGINAHPGDENIDNTSASKKQLIYSNLNRNNSDFVKVSINYTANDNYDYIWIYPYLDDWWCNGDNDGQRKYIISKVAVMIEQNHINNRIFAQSQTEKGKYINADYTIINSGTHVNFVADKKIFLNTGFKTNPGSYFSASISDIYLDCPQSFGLVYNSSEFKEVQEDVSLNQNSIMEISADSTVDIKIFPNPTNGVATIYLNRDAIYMEIFDINGKIIHMQDIQDKNTFDIDISSYPKGIYNIKVVGTKFICNKKLLKI
jgi:hypothetical protein